MNELDPRDPPRLLSLEDQPSEPLRGALQLAQDDLPDQARMQRVWAALPGVGAGPGDGGPGDGGPGDGGPGDGGPGDGGPGGGGALGGAGSGAAGGSSLLAKAAGGSLFSKAASVALVGAALSGVVYLGIKQADPPPSRPTAEQPVPPAESQTPAAPLPLSADLIPAPTGSASNLTIPSPSQVPESRPPEPATSALPAVRSEIEILREAQAQLASNPKQTLVLVAEHERSHPRGNMGQEREMLRIQALQASGQGELARKLALAFMESHPDSAYTARLRGMFP